MITAIFDTDDIYRNDIVFRDPLNKFQGLRFYKYMFLSLRWHARILFKSIHVEIRNIWLAQEGTIRSYFSFFIYFNFSYLESDGPFVVFLEYLGKQKVSLMVSPHIN